MIKSVLEKTSEKRKKRNQMILGGFLVLIIGLSTFGYSLNMQNKETVNKAVYNGLEFVEDNGFWKTFLGNLNLVFRYNPKQLEGFIYDKELADLISYSNEPLYLNYEDNEAGLEIYNNLNQIAERMQGACLNEENCEGDLPIKNCSSNIIIIKEANSSSIKQQENCIFIEGKREDLTKLTDEYLFRLFGIKEE